MADHRHDDGDGGDDDGEVAAAAAAAVALVAVVVVVAVAVVVEGVVLVPGLEEVLRRYSGYLEPAIAAAFERRAAGEGMGFLVLDPAQRDLVGSRAVAAAAVQAVAAAGNSTVVGPVAVVGLDLWALLFHLLLR